MQNEPLAKHTTMNVGGTTPAFIEPETEESLIYAIRSAEENNIPFRILGGGSNTIFPDQLDFAVISTRSIKEEITFNSQLSTLHIPSGASWGSVISFCKKNNLGGFEPFTGLSGTAGGAIYMNATCFGLTTSDNLLSSKQLKMHKEELSIETYVKNADEWGYKKSPFQNADKIILSAEFKVTEGFDEAKSQEVKEKRIAMGHFKAPSAGSAFKNKPEENIIAGKIIDECGLKGFSMGGAQIAPWHGNFIINPDRKATCADIKALVEYVQKVVFEKKGIQLEPEILFL